MRRYSAAGGVVVDRHGRQVLLLLRRGRMGPDGQPEVRLPKGHIEPGEDRLRAAQREVAEEAGLDDLQIIADLGHQAVDFHWQGKHTIRDESYFLMALPAGVDLGQPEPQFERLWLTWEEALTRLSFEAEREWVQRARQAWLEFGAGTSVAPECKQNAAYDVVGLGYCVYDILAIVTGPLDFDNVAMIPLADLVHDGGGQVSTALTALARLGARTAYIGLLGSDREGHWLRQRFVQEGVDVARLRHDEEAGTNVCLVLVDQPTARRALLCHRRVRPEALVLDDVDRQLIQSARVLHLDGQHMPAAIQAAKWAREVGVKVCYDGNRLQPGLQQLLPLVDWLVVAAPFPAAYTGLQDPAQAARALLAQGAELVAVTNGEHGCRVWTVEGDFEAPGFPVPAKDTTGAGDAFHGAFIYGMLQGWSLHQVARFANAAAGLNCLTLGGRRGLPSLGQVQQFLASSPAPSPRPLSGGASL